MATHSNILAWKIPWTEEPDRLHLFLDVSLNHLTASLPPACQALGAIRNIHVQGDQTTLHLKNTIAYRITGKLLVVPPQLHPYPNLQAHLLHAISCLHAIFMLFLILVDSAPHLLQSPPQVLTHPSRPCSVVYLFIFLLEIFHELPVQFLGQVPLLWVPTSLVHNSVYYLIWI